LELNESQVQPETVKSDSSRLLETHTCTH